MNQQSQTDKRFVSKGEYIRAKIKRTMVVAGGIASFCVAVTSTFFVFAHFVLAQTIQHNIGYSLCIALAMICIISCIGLVFSIDVWWRIVQEKAQSIDPGIPLTRANTADLPAPESLVRASSEPMQEHEAVLLRAATESQEKHEDQLVRAAERPE